MFATQHTDGTSARAGEEVKGHFNELVFTTVIQRNVKLSESRSYAQPVIVYDADSKGALDYIQLAKELTGKNS